MSFCQIKSNNYIFAFLSVSFSEAPQYFQFLTENLSFCVGFVFLQKMSFCVGRNNHRRKSNFVTFEKTNATAYDQNV